MLFDRPRLNLAPPLAAALPFALMSAAFGQTADVRTADAALPVLFAHDRAELIHFFPSASIDIISGGCVVVTPAAFEPPILTVDPRYRGSYARAAYVYAPRQEGAAHGLFRIVTVHYGPEMRDTAQRSSRLIARLWTLYRDRFRHEIIFPLQADEADFYLTSEAPPDGGGVGGETHNDQIYIFRVGIAERTSLEWVRTIAHEWGHLTLAAARGYRDPESDAAGYLGERLALKWLRAEQSKRPADAPDDGTTGTDLDRYYQRQVAPLMERWRQGGPGSALLDGANTEAMDYYIGAVLATDDALGSAITGRALYTVLADRARDFLVALRHNLAETPTFTVQTPAWVPLSRGIYRTHSVGGTAPMKPGVLSVSHPAWQKLVPQGGSATLKLTRQELIAP